MNSIKFIWFDLGYTLLFLDRERPYSQLLESKGFSIEVEDIEKAFHLSDKFFMREHIGLLGKNPHCYMDDYLNMLNAELGINATVTYAEMLNTYNLMGISNMRWKPYTFSIDTLKRIKKNNIKVGLITNWDKTAKNIVKDSGLDNLLDEMIVSSDVGIEKPDQKIFELALEKQNVNPNECIYIGDNYYDDVLGSKKIGMEALLINRFGTYGIEELEIESYESIKEAVASLGL